MLFNLCDINSYAQNDSINKTQGAIIQFEKMQLDINPQKHQIITFYDTAEVDTSDINSIRSAQNSYLILKNTGDQPLLIHDVKSSDPCYASSWDRVPILPGQTSQIIFSCPYWGKKHNPIFPNHCSTYITSNAVNAPELIIKFRKNYIFVKK